MPLIFANYLLLHRERQGLSCFLYPIEEETVRGIEENIFDLMVVKDLAAKP